MTRIVLGWKVFLPDFFLILAGSTPFVSFFFFLFKFWAFLGGSLQTLGVCETLKAGAEFSRNLCEGRAYFLCVTSRLKT